MEEHFPLDLRKLSCSTVKACLQAKIFLVFVDLTEFCSTI